MFLQHSVPQRHSSPPLVPSPPLMPAPPLVPSPPLVPALPPPAATVWMPDEHKCVVAVCTAELDHLEFVIAADPWSKLHSLLFPLTLLPATRYLFVGLNFWSVVQRNKKKTKIDELHALLTDGSLTQAAIVDAIMPPSGSVYDALGHGRCDGSRRGSKRQIDECRVRIGARTMAGGGPRALVLELTFRPRGPLSAGAASSSASPTKPTMELELTHHLKQRARNGAQWTARGGRTTRCNVVAQVIKRSPGLAEWLEAEAREKLRTCQEADLANSTCAKPRAEAAAAHGL